jgi:SAM-dependent methyltransferase
MRGIDEQNLQFWEKRYIKQEYEWGIKPSILALKAPESVPAGGTVLDVACGYGRDAIFLAKSGYQTYAMDFSPSAIKRGRDWAQRENLQIDFKNKELIDCGYSENFFDGVIMFNTLHLLWKPKRMEVVSEVHRILKPGGKGLFAFFSTKEEGFGVGEEVEENSFTRAKGRMRHYFTREDINEHFSAYSSISAEEFFIPPEDHEHHGRKEHGHYEWLVIAVK